MRRRILPFNRRLRTLCTPRSSFAATCGTSAPQGGGDSSGIASWYLSYVRGGRGLHVAFNYGFFWEAVSFYLIDMKGLVFNK